MNRLPASRSSRKPASNPRRTIRSFEGYGESPRSRQVLAVAALAVVLAAIAGGMRNDSARAITFQYLEITQKPVNGVFRNPRTDVF